MITFKQGTQEDYDALSSHDEDTFYKTESNLYLGEMQLNSSASAGVVESDTVRYLDTGQLVKYDGSTGLTKAYIGTIASGTTLGDYSFSVGYDNTASSDLSYAEGGGTTASGLLSHAEGEYTTASNYASHAEGSNTKASGNYSHAEGFSTEASSSFSHAEGNETTATARSNHVFGEYNVSDINSPDERGQYIEIVGNGTSDEERSNARTLDWSGNETLAGSLTLGSTTLTEEQLQQLLELL